METRRSILQKLTLGALSVIPSKLIPFPLAAAASQKAEVSSTAYHVKVNCAGPAVDDFSADQPYRSGSWGYTHGGQYFECNSVSNDYGIPAAIKTLRYSCGAQFHYKFDAPNGYYRVKMYFVSPNELYGPRVFNVLLNGKLVLANFRAFPVNTGFLSNLIGFQ